jgi:DNA-directed RNA polymerase beta subunit
MSFSLISQFLEETKLVKHQIDLFNYFVSEEIQEILEEEFPIITKHFTIQLIDYEIKKPEIIIKKKKNLENSNNQIHQYETEPLFPNVARLNNISYDGKMFLNLNVKVNKTKKIEKKKFLIANLPIMVRSKLCNLTEENKIKNQECFYDNGGYFIFKGKERTLVGQFRKAYNKVFVEENKKNDKYTHIAEIRSMNFNTTSTLIQLKINKLYQMFFSLPFIKSKNLFPVGTLFKIFNIPKEKINQYIHLNFFNHENVKKFVKTIEEQYDISNDFLNSLSSEINQTQEEIKNTILNNIFNHLTFPDGKENVIDIIFFHLGYIIRKLILTILNIRNYDDKQNLCNKRIDGTNSLLKFLFRLSFKNFVKILIQQINVKKNLPELHTIIQEIKIINTSFQQAFLTGNWNIYKNIFFTRVGVSQVLSTQNYGARISHLRRLMIPIGKKGKNIDIRLLHPSSFSFICPYETPEGDTVGLVVNLALTALISINQSNLKIYKYISKFQSFNKNPFQKILILLNGEIIGSCNEEYNFSNFPIQLNFVKEFDDFRKNNSEFRFVSIAFLKSELEIQIFSDEGRFLRPLFRLEKNKNTAISKSWKENVDNYNIVFRDSFELEQSLVCMDLERINKNYIYDYSEICPSVSLMGLMASAIPFSNHSQSPRIVYQSSMGKQAIGVPTLTWNKRFDTTYHILNYPQQPITRNEIMNVINFNQMSHGQNPIVAIMTFSGFNQEDSVILNKSSIERGLFVSTTYKTISEKEKKKKNSEFEKICFPDYSLRNPNYNYSFIDSNGLIKSDTKNFLKKNTVIIAKVKILLEKTGSDSSEQNFSTDCSIVIKNGEEGYLDEIIDTYDDEGIRIIKIRIRSMRIPEIGDKFASCTAQKGTCGMIFSQEDLPFDSDGISPDLIINPHAIPSRMTINMLLEMTFNLIGCKNFKYSDSTPFKHKNIQEELLIWMKKNNIDGFEKEMYCGRTGKKFPNKIFIAPSFYQRLKHLVDEKIHAREDGPIDMLTRQPIAGRSRDGGLRFGEMENNCTCAHGCSAIINSCLFLKSDKFQIPLCESCGIIVDNRKICQICKNHVILKNIPYASKIVYQELLSMGFKLKIQ